MSDFKKWFKSLNENGRVTYFLGQEGRISEEAWNHQQAIIDEHTEVIKLQDTDLRKYEKQIESLKEQLNNIEQCYIDVKKERDELQSKSRCIRNLVEQRNLAENMLRKISIAAQKKLPTFGAALRFNDEVKEILRGGHETN